jgi:type I restriction enzyme, S subunit
MPQSNWKRVQIKELYSGFWDGPHATPKVADSGPIYLGIKNISEDGHLDFSDIRHIAEEDFSKWIKRVEPRPGDIVFTYEATLHRYAIIPEGFRGCLGRRLALIRTNPDAVETKFLYYYFFGKEWRNTVSKYIMSGATVDRIPIIHFPKFEVNLPPLPVQRKIADVLSAYDDLIEVNTRRIRVLEQMAQSVYREWFGKVDGNLLPEGWEVKPFGELLSFDINGGWGEEEQSEQFTVPGYVIRGTDIPGGRYGQFDKVPFRYHKQSNFASRQLLDRDIVIEIAGGSKGQPVGRALLIGQQLLDKFDNKVICASFCKLLRPNQSIVSSEYLYLHLREIYENGIIEKYQTQSTGIINFKSTFFLEDNLVIVPDKTMMDKFIEFVRPLFEMIGTLGAKNANLRRTRDLLLPRLVSGEVSVEGLEIEGENINDKN